MTFKPVLGVTMGDPAGIGPEIVVKALAEPRVHDFCLPVVAAVPEVMLKAARDIVGNGLEIRILDRVSAARGGPGRLEVLPLAGVKAADYPLGRVDADCGDAAFKSVRTVIELALRGEIDGTVTAPLNKEAMNLAGHHYDGHTEIYAALTGVKKYAMLLVDGRLRVAHVSTHVPLARAGALITRERVLEVARLGNEACRRFGVARPRVAVAGFNPHAGENGLFGREELDVISPAIADARREGIDASGPYPPDSVFCRAAGGGFDLVVAMYHDQGHIPLKRRSFKYDAAADAWSGMTGVNLTLGLPIVRASVDHGTAFANAGRNVSSPASLLNALECGAMLAGGRGPAGKNQSGAAVV